MQAMTKTLKCVGSASAERCEDVSGAARLCFCSRECIKQHWTRHQMDCRRLKALREAAKGEAPPQ